MKINEEKCIGCGLCANLCPEVFELGEDGQSKIKKGADLHPCTPGVKVKD